MDTKKENRRLAQLRYNSSEKGKAYKAKWRKDNLQHRLECEKERYRKNPERVKRNVSNWKAKNPDRYKLNLRSAYLKRKYGITLAQYDALMTKQNGCCAICRDKHPKLCIDHCHKTGVVRGLLCQNCNSAIGFLREDMGVWREVCNYLWTPWNTADEIFKRMKEAA